MKAIQKKLLLASVAVGVFTPFFTNGEIVHAEKITVQPEESSNNTVEVNEKDYSINGRTTQINEDDEYSDVSGGEDEYSVDNNTVTINDGKVNFIVGGYSWNYNTGNVSNNTITINDGEISTVIGGLGNYGTTDNDTTFTGNTVNINGGKFLNEIYATDFACGTSLTNATVIDNSVNIKNNPDLTSAVIYGYRYIPAIHSGNALNIYTKGLEAQNLYNFDNMNFYLDSNINSGDTILKLIGGSRTDVSDTDIKAVMQSGSTLTSGDSVTLLANEAGITDAKSYTGEIAEGVSITYPLTVYRADDGNSIIALLGSKSDDTPTDDTPTDDTPTDDTPIKDTPVTVDDSNNIVNLTESGSDIYGGKTDSGNAQNNTVNLYSGSYDKIYGGYAPNGSTSGNVLNVYNKNLTAQNIYNFDKLNFYIPKDAVNGDTMLTLTDSDATDLSGVAIKAGVVEGNTNLAVDDKIILLMNSNGIKTDSSTSYGTLTEGVSLDYGLKLSNFDDSVAAIVESVPQSLNSQTQSIPLSSGLTSIKTLDTVLDNNNLPAIGLEFDFESDSEDGADVQEMGNTTVVEPKGWEIFASAGGGSLRTKAGDGAYVDMKTTSFDLGLARTLDNGGAGKLAFAPIIDYAHGNYDSYLADGTHGTGSTKYIAGGGIFRNMWDNGFYVEGSFRLGKVKNDFASNDMDKILGQRVSYDTDATAMAGHLKIGKNLRLNKNNLLDVYATYYHSHQGSMDATIAPYGDKYSIDSANSGRFKLGYRLTTRTSKISRIYTGLAFQYEHTGDITANYISRNLSTKSAGNSGSSGMLELGWIIKPLKNNPWAVDINATGWIGHQRGVTAMAKVQKSF